MTVSEKMKYEAQIIRLRASRCRMDREYADYLDRWLHSPESVDGTPYEMRMNSDDREPMPYNSYWLE